MLRDASFPFLVTGLASVVIGGIALLGRSLPLADFAKWTVPVVLLTLGLAGLFRQLAKR